MDLVQRVIQFCSNNYRALAMITGVPFVFAAFTARLFGVRIYCLFDKTVSHIQLLLDFMRELQFTKSNIRMIQLHPQYEKQTQHIVLLAAAGTAGASGRSFAGVLAS